MDRRELGRIRERAERESVDVWAVMGVDSAGFYFDGTRVSSLFHEQTISTASARDVRRLSNARGGVGTDAVVVSAAMAAVVTNVLKKSFENSLFRRVNSRDEILCFEVSSLPWRSLPSNINIVCA